MILSHWFNTWFSWHSYSPLLYKSEQGMVYDYDQLTPILLKIEIGTNYFKFKRFTIE